MYEMGQEEIDAVTKVLESKQMFRYRGGEGGQVNQVEEMINSYTGCKYSVVMTSGTAALTCGLVGMGIGPGDEVIVPAYTWLASAGAILLAGAIPVLAEVDETLTLDPADFESRIGPRTKAVIPVHMAGHPTDMDSITAIAKKHNLKVLEDACQGIGGTFKGKQLGSIGDAGAYSFNQFKNITCGEGGALMTSDRSIHERALYYHDMGCTFRGHAGEMTEEAFLGNTYRMNEILGAVLRVQFGRLDSILARLRERRAWLLDAVAAADSPAKANPSADNEGDCGCHVPFIFETSEQREKFEEKAKEINEECGMGSPINSGLHVYTNWKVLLEQKGGHHPALNPFKMEENKDCRLEITADDCPRTLEILKRTSSIAVGIDWSKEKCEKLAATICQAASEVSTAGCA